MIKTTLEVVSTWWDSCCVIKADLLSPPFFTLAFSLAHLLCCLLSSSPVVSFPFISPSLQSLFSFSLISSFLVASCPLLCFHLASFSPLLSIHLFSLSSTISSQVKTVATKTVRRQSLCVSACWAADAPVPSFSLNLVNAYEIM